DDDAESLCLVERMVRSGGHAVVTARNGVDALEKLALQTFDLIICDILMPAMDGFQLCRTIKSDHRLKNIPLVFYTATYTAKADEELALGLGASRFLVKPSKPAEFLGMVEEVLREAEIGKIPVPAVQLGDDESLSLYSERLVHKLEDKIRELELAR